MRLTNRSKKRHRTRGPWIAISQDEITADLNYRGGQVRRNGRSSVPRGPRGSR